MAQIASVQANLAAAQQRAGLGVPAVTTQRSGSKSGDYKQHTLVLNEAGEAVDSKGNVVKVKAVSAAINPLHLGERLRRCF